MSCGSTREIVWWAVLDRHCLPAKAACSVDAWTYQPLIGPQLCDRVFLPRDLSDVRLSLSVFANLGKALSFCRCTRY